MQKQRGSVTVIAIVMLLFLMVVAIAWLPMMTIEKTAASSDYREQQAWYAAEAGYKRAVAALENKNSDWLWLTKENDIQNNRSENFGHLSINGSTIDQNGVWYAVGIMQDNVDIALAYTPEDNATYQITSVGSCQGIRKVIRRTHALGGSGEGGEENPEQPPDAYINDSFVTSSGLLIINADVDYAKENKVYYSGYFADYTVGGQVINKELTPNPKYKSAAVPETFNKSQYKNMKDINYTLNTWTDANGQSIASGNYWAPKADFTSTKISVSDNTVLLVGQNGYWDGKDCLKMTNVEINVPKGKTLEFVIIDKGVVKDYNNVNLKNVTIKGGGQVSFISEGTTNISDIRSEDNSKLLFIANKGLYMRDPHINADSKTDGGCFMSSAGNMEMLVSSGVTATFYGQMQSSGLISIGGQSGNKGKLILRFNKIAEKLKLPDMYYLSAA